MSFEAEKLRALLDETYEWPADYTYKFIVPKGKLPDLEKLLGGAEIKTRPSKNGNYISVTAVIECDSAQDILDMYNTVADIEGLISL